MVTADAPWIGSATASSHINTERTNRLNMVVSLGEVHP